MAPYFNATREGSYQIEEQVNVKITGDQKLTPFPAFTLSTQTDGKRYAFLSEPVSDWFVNGAVAQSLDPWHPPGVHTLQTMQAGVDFYYQMGFLINFYAHGLSTGDQGPMPYPQTAGYLIPAYIQYGMNAQLHPNLWPANARAIYQWWLNRSTAQVTAHSYPTNGSHTVATATITGSQDTNTAIEVFAATAGSFFVPQLLTNGVAAGTNAYRITGETIKVRVGTAVTNVQIEYFPCPIARDHTYPAIQGQSFTVGAAAGVLSNDWSGTWSGLVAITNGGPSHGTLAWDINGDGGFTYTPTTNFWGTDCFTYEATDGQNNFGTATVTISVTATNSLTTDLYSDDFVRCLGTALDPWQAGPSPSDGQWNLGGGAMQGSQPGNAYGYCYVGTAWTNYTVEAQVQLASGSYGGGLGGRLTTSNGAHYAAWIYPGNVINLVKFWTWTTWGYNGNQYAPMARTNVTVGAGWHQLQLVCSNDLVQVAYHGTNVITTTDTDTNAPPYPTGAVSLDVYAGAISVSNLLVIPLP